MRAPASSGWPLLLAANGEASTGLIRAELTLPLERGASDDHRSSYFRLPQAIRKCGPSRRGVVRTSPAARAPPTKRRDQLPS